MEFMIKKDLTTSGKSYNIKEIKLLKNQLLLNADNKLMKRMLYLKGYEKKLRDQITN